MNHFSKKIRNGLLLAAALILTAFVCFRLQSGTESAPSPADEEFETFLGDLFRQEAASNALSLHYILEDPEHFGITDYNTDLGIYSAENTRVSAALAENLLNTLHSFEVNTLQTDNRITLDVLEASLENARMAAAFPYYEEPLRVSTGEQAELPVLLAEYTFRTIQDIEDYLAILDSIPSYFSGICQYEREKASRGLFMADFAAETIISQCRDFASSGDNNYLIYTFDEKVDAIDGLTPNERTAYKRQNRAIVAGRVLPAFLGISDTLNEILQSESDSPENKAVGLCSLPNGQEYYRFLVKQYTGSGDPVETLQKRTEKKRDEDLKRAADLLSAYPDLEYDMINASAPCDSPEEMLALLEKEIHKEFPSVAHCDYTLKYVDSAMEDYMAPAFYLTAPLDHFTENSIYINKKNGYQGLHLFTTLAHEGFPGHLYQNAVYSSTNPAPIRALLGTAGYTEGWATYVEMLSYRYAGLSDETAGALSLEQSAILSLYASADMGIHHDGWTFAETLQFFSQYGFTDENTIRDIFELIVEEPAHYLKYYIGYLEFLDLKEYAKKTDGENYSDLSFHRTVLEMGPAPFPILKKYY